MIGPATLPSRRRVLLVEPAAVESNVFSAWTGLPLLGPLYLGTALRQAGHDVTVVNEDLLGRRIAPSDLDADDLLLSCLTPTVERGYEIADRFKEHNPQGRVFMGGPHVSFEREEALRHADHVVVGEGERIIADLIAHGTSEPVVEGPPVEDLDTLPVIDWSLLARRDRLDIQPLMFSRGCPFSCNFCSVTAMFGRGYRTMSIERALEEVRNAFLPKLFFYDDNLAVDRRRTHRLVDGLLDQRDRIRWWTAQVRTDITRDEELLARMARSRCARVFVGLESVNDRALAEMGKGQTSDDIRRAVQRFHAHGLSVHGMFIFGSDADDAQAIRATNEFVRQERIDSTQYMILTPFPGTELYERMRSSGRLLHRKWRYYDGMHVVIRPEKFAPYELQKLTLDSYQDFYSLARAMNDGLEAVAAVARQFAGQAIHRLTTSCCENAILKLLGKRLIRRWMKSNAEYLQSLRRLSSPDEPCVESEGA